MRKMVAYILVLLFVCLSLNAISIAALDNDQKMDDCEKSDRSTLPEATQDDGEDVEINKVLDTDVKNAKLTNLVGSKVRETDNFMGINLGQNQPRFVDNNGISKEKMNQIENNIKKSNLGFILDDRPGVSSTGNSNYNAIGTGGVDSGNIKVNKDYGTDTQYEPSIAIGPTADNIYMAWVDNRYLTQNFIYFAKSTDGGKTFQSYRTINEDGNAGSPEIAVDKNEDIFVVWHDNRDGNYDIWFSKSTNKGNTWATNICVHPIDKDHNQTNPTMAIDNSYNPPTIWVAWQDSKKVAGSHDGIWITHSFNSGLSFMDLSEVYTNSQKRDSMNPDIAVDDQGYIWIAWNEGRTNVSDQDIFYTRSNAASTPALNNPSFSFTTKVDDGPARTNQTRPVLLTYNHTVAYVIWEDDRSGFSTDIYFTSYVAGTSNFTGSSKRVNKNIGDLTNQIWPSMALNYTTGDLYISWLDGRNGYYETYFIKSTNQGSSFIDETLVNDAFGNLQTSRKIYNLSQSNLVVDDNGNIHLLYSQNRYGNEDIFYQRSNDYGITWSNSKMVNENSTEGSQRNFFQYQLAIDQNEIVHIVWEDTRANNISIGTDIYYAKSLDYGLTFTPGVVVNYKFDGVQKNPCIAVNDSWIYVAWTESPDISQSGDIYFSYSKDGGNTFEYDTNILENLIVNNVAVSTSNDYASIALNSSDHVFIAYQGFNEFAVPPTQPSMDIYVGYANYSAILGEFNLFQQVNANNDSSSVFVNDQHNPAIAIDQNIDNIYVVFEDNRNQSRFGPDIFIGVTNTSAKSFDRNYKVNDETNDVQIANTNHNHPSIALNNTGYISVVWHDDRTGSNNIYFTRSADQGENWTTNVRVNTDTNQEKTKPSIFISNNETIYVAWQDNRNGNEDIYLAKSIDAGSSFSAGVRVDDDTDDFDQLNPAVAVNLTGGIYVVWTDERNYYTNVVKKVDYYIARSDDDGVSFNENYCIHTYQGEPAIAVDEDGTIHTVWTDYRFGKWDIFYAKSRVGGQYFQANIPINRLSTNSRGNPDIAVYNGEVFIVWEDGRESEDNKTILFTKSMDGGKSFGNNVDISKKFGNQVNPAIAVDKLGVAHVVWQDNSIPSKGQLYYSNSTNWSKKTAVFSPSLNINLWNPTITVEDGLTGINIYIGMENRTNLNDWDISVTTSTNGGRTFSHSLLVNDDFSGLRQANPSIDCDSKGNVVLVWQDHRSTSWDIYESLSNDNGTTFSLNILVNKSSEQEMEPDVIIDRMSSSRIAIAFQTNNNTNMINNYDIYVALSGDGGTTYSTTIRLDDSGSSPQNQIEPQVATDGKGSLHCIWEDFRHGNGDIYYTSMDDTSPLADAGPDQYIDQNEYGRFIANNSWDNLGLANYTWTLVDGSTQNVYGYNNNYLFNTPGDYQVTLTVKDYNNNQDTDTLWVYVRDRSPPSFGTNSTPKVAYTGDSFTFTVSVTDNYQMGIVNVKYYYGSGGTPTTVSMTPTGNPNEFGYTIQIPDTYMRLVYEFSANDTTNNWRFASTNVVPVLDNDIPIFGTDSTPTGTTTGESLTFTILCTDNIKVDAGYVEYWYGTGTHNKVQMSAAGANTYTYMINQVQKYSIATLHYNFSFKDNSTMPSGENWNSTSVKDITVTDNDLPYFVADNSDTAAYANKTFKFSLQFGDNINTQKAVVHYWFGSGTPNPTHEDLTLTSGNWEKSIKIPNSLNAMHYNFTFWDTSNNWNITTAVQVAVTDDTNPFKISGSGDIETTTGEPFEIFAKFNDNVGIGLVTVFFSKETTASWTEKVITSTTNKYLITNTGLGINTSEDTIGWKYYFEAEDTSANKVTHGTAGNPYLITVTDNDKPIADAGNDITKKVGSTVTFDASGSIDNIGIVTYEWSFEYDGAPKTLSGVTDDFKFEIADDYEVTLKVIDKAGNFDTDKVMVYITSDQEKPVIVLDGPIDEFESGDTFVTLSWHTTHANYDLVTYDLYFSDSPNPKTPFKEDITDSDTSDIKVEYTVEDLEEKTYYWYVVGKIGTNVGLPSEERSFTIDFAIQPNYGVTLDSDETSIKVKVGTSESITLTATNTGSSIDIFDFTVDKGTFPKVTFEYDQLQLAASLSGDSKLTFETTENTPIDTYTITVTITSTSSVDTVISDSVEIEVETYKDGDDTDTDNDNLPDAWEIEHFGDITKYDGNDDPDGDGYTNKQEYEKGSDPLDKYSPDKKKDGDGEDLTGVYLGVVAVIVIVVILLLVFLMMRNKGGKGEEEEEPEKPEQPPRAPGTLGGGAGAGTITPSTPTKPVVPPTTGPRPGSGPGTGTTTQTPQTPQTGPKPGTPQIPGQQPPKVEGN